MKIAMGGTPIFVTKRQKGGIEVIQGRSRLKLDKHEIVGSSQLAVALVPAGCDSS